MTTTVRRPYDARRTARNPHLVPVFLEPDLSAAEHVNDTPATEPSVIAAARAALHQIHPEAYAR